MRELCKCIRCSRGGLCIVVLWVVLMPRTSLAQGTEDAASDGRTLVYPIPVSPLWKNAEGREKAGDESTRQSKREAYDRARVLPPQPPGGPTASDQEPSTSEVLRFLSESDVTPGVVSLDDLESQVRHIDVERISATIDPPREFPLIGLAQIRRTKHRCTVCLRSAEWDSAKASRERTYETHVVVIQQTHLHMVDDDEKKEASTECERMKSCW